MSSNLETMTPEQLMKQIDRIVDDFFDETLIIWDKGDPEVISSKNELILSLHNLVCKHVHPSN
jgi:hypothetical protein